MPRKHCKIGKVRTTASLRPCVEGKSPCSCFVAMEAADEENEKSLGGRLPASTEARGLERGLKLKRGPGVEKLGSLCTILFLNYLEQLCPT